MTPSRRTLLGVGLAALILTLPGCMSTTRQVGSSGTEASAGAAHLGPIRARNGLASLTADSTLAHAALEQARYMAESGQMEHTTRFGRDFRSRMGRNGIGGAAAENIAHGRMEPDELFERWMNSAGHRRNMLDPRFTRFGLAWVEEADGSGRRYWALVLAS